LNIYDHFKQQAQYNLWADKLLLEHVALLSDEQYLADKGLFFNSVHGTLNHLVLGSSAWYSRLVGDVFEFSGLDQELYTNRQCLAEELVLCGQRWVCFIDAISVEKFNTPITYQTSKGQTICLPAGQLLAHVFNHATHHRGQVSVAFSAEGEPVPKMDLIYYLLEEGGLLIE